MCVKHKQNLNQCWAEINQCSMFYRVVLCEFAKNMGKYSQQIQISHLIKVIISKNRETYIIANTFSHHTAYQNDSSERLI